MNEDQDKNRHAANQEFAEALEQLKSLSEASEAQKQETTAGDRPVDADDPLWEDALADIERYLREKGQE